MNNRDEYIIAFSGLAPGTHDFEFKVEKEFFEAVEDAEISDGNVAVSVVMVKEERMMDLHFTLDGTVVLPCDRCNEPVEMEVKGTERLIVKLGDRYFEESEDIQIIPETDHQFDLRSFIYEYIHLLLPIRRIHPEDANGNSQCDPEVMKKLREITVDKEPDPRWDALRKLKDQS